MTGGVAIDDTRTPQRETLEDLSKRAMDGAKRIANGRTWGEACTLLVKHPLGRIKVVAPVFNRGPFPAWGDPGTLNANFYSYHEESQSFRAHVGPSMRFVLDWADVDAFTLTGALGQSGHVRSPHYDDFLPMMRKGEAWNVPFTREKVFAKKTSVLTLRSRSSGSAR